MCTYKCRKVPTFDSIDATNKFHSKNNKPQQSDKSFFFFLRDFIFKKTLFEKLQYLKQEQYKSREMFSMRPLFRGINPAKVFELMVFHQLVRGRCRGLRAVGWPRPWTAVTQFAGATERRLRNFADDLWHGTQQTSNTNALER